LIIEAAGYYQFVCRKKDKFHQQNIITNVCVELQIKLQGFSRQHFPGKSFDFLVNNFCFPDNHKGLDFTVQETT